MGVLFIPIRRCHIVSPVKGWGSIATENGYIIIEPLSARPRYRVVYPEGVIVRSAADIDDSDFVRVIAKGEVVEGTGQVQMYDNVERIQVGKEWRGDCARALPAHTLIVFLVTCCVAMHHYCEEWV